MTRWTVVRRGESDDDRDRGGPTGQRFVIEESLGYLVNRAARKMAQDLAEELRPTGVGIGQWAVMLFLWAGDGTTQAELARVVAIEPPTLARTLDRMERDGLVERRPDPSDARLSRIHLTRRGRTLRDELVPKAVAVNRRAEADLSATERRGLRRLLKALGSGQEPPPG